MEESSQLVHIRNWLIIVLQFQKDHKMRCGGGNPHYDLWQEKEIPPFNTPVCFPKRLNAAIADNYFLK